MRLKIKRPIEPRGSTPAEEVNSGWDAGKANIALPASRFKRRHPLNFQGRQRHERARRSPIRPRPASAFIKMLGLLGSDHDGEIVTAGRMAHRAASPSD